MHNTYTVQKLKHKKKEIRVLPFTNPNVPPVTILKKDSISSSALMSSFLVTTTHSAVTDPMMVMNE